MGLFTREGKEPEVTGVDVLRQWAHARNKSPTALAMVAGNIEGLSPGTLEDFSKGRANLSDDVLVSLALELSGKHTTFDPETRMLRSANTATAKPLCAAGYPGRFNPNDALHPVVTNTDGNYGGRITPVTPQPPAASLKRPGWA